jgi:putative ABC transport system permease protein
LDDIEVFDLQNIDFIAGGWPEEGEKELVLGYQLAETNKWSVGDEIPVKGDKYVVSGILEEMYNFIDYGALGSITDIADTFGMEDYYSTLSIEPADVSDSKRIANEIMEAYDTLDAMTSDEALQMANEVIGQIRLMTLSIGIVASLVASIGIINTMVVVVLERKQEFGIMKALGAKRVVILSIVVQEAVIIGIIGSILGILIGYAGTEGINKASAFPIASVTPTLALFSLLYGILLSVVASLYPSYSAINVDPVDSMREM